MSRNLKRASTLYRQQPRARKKPSFLIYLLWFLLLACAGIFCVWSSSQVLEEQYKIAKLNQRLSRLELKNHELKSEVARLESPSRLERIAKTKLGLVYPEPSQILSLEDMQKEQVKVARP